MQRIGIACLFAACVGAAFASCIRMQEPDEFICDRDGDCDSKEHCYQGTCLADNCTRSDDCAGSGLAASEQICVAGKCRPPECTASKPDCPNQLRCDTSTRTCKEKCAGDSDCRVPATCVAQQCVIQCRDSLDCVGGYACHSGRCASSCEAPEDCGAGYACALDGTCQLSIMPPAAMSCSSDGDCASLHCCSISGEEPICSATACSRLGSNAPCEYAVQCMSLECLAGICRDGTTSPPTTGAAAGASCTSNAACASEKCCRGLCLPDFGTCLGDYGDACRDNGDCLLGLTCRDNGGGAVTGTCSKLCGANVECRTTVGSKKPAQCVQGDDGKILCRARCNADAECVPNVTTCEARIDEDGESHAICLPL